ncbi:Cupredoxin [Gautieria morchelliformis]|nr:Cupredoxin [Gautieria morchelliformis]
MRSFMTLALAAIVPALVSAANLSVAVGSNNSLTFDPPSMNASVGDMINFVFLSKNHSVFASSFADPCTNDGFTSPFFPVNGSSAPFPSFILNVSSTTPIWFYCAQTNHCKSGMVGVINPPVDKTFTQFQANAMANSTANSTSSGSNSTGSPTGSSSPSATTKPNSAVRTSSGAALLTLVGIVAGITAL